MGYQKKIEEILKEISSLRIEERIEAINTIKIALSKISPFASEPVDCVLWIKSDKVQANDYNPNSVAPPEMKLLETSIMNDGYTQPIVTWPVGNGMEVIDGFHRNRVGKESEAVRSRVYGYLPVVTIKPDREGRNDRIASTIRHNRARGKHKIDAMSDIVIELKRRNWTDDRISRELGMDRDEILRLVQITGLTEMFSDQEFSKSWDVEGAITESDIEELSDDISTYGDEAEGFRTVNTSDSNRVFHTYENWECYKAGFYNTTVNGMTKEECENAYKEFLSDTKRFSEALAKVTTEWKNSCQHYLTNSAMNRIAWLGQAAACYALGIPSTFRGGFNLLTESQQDAANEVALEYLNKWLQTHDREILTMEEAYSGRQSDIY